MRHTHNHFRDVDRTSCQMWGGLNHIQGPRPSPSPSNMELLGLSSCPAAVRGVPRHTVRHVALAFLALGPLLVLQAATWSACPLTVTFDVFNK